MPTLIKVRQHPGKDKDGPHPVVPSSLGANNRVWTSKQRITIQLHTSCLFSDHGSVFYLTISQSLNTAKICFHSCLYSVYSNDIRLIVIPFLNNQKLLPRLRLMQQHQPHLPLPAFVVGKPATPTQTIALGICSLLFFF